MSCHTFDGGREIFGRYVQTLGIVAHITLRSADARSQQSHQLFHDVGCAVGMGVCCITLGMGLEDVVHHRQAETAHQFVIELQMAVVLAVTQPMEVITAALALLISTACSGGAKQEKVMAKDGKALVVFFSHAGDNYAEETLRWATRLKPLVKGLA